MDLETVVLGETIRRGRIRHVRDGHPFSHEALIQLVRFREERLVLLGQDSGRGDRVGPLTVGQLRDALAELLLASPLVFGLGPDQTAGSINLGQGIHVQGEAATTQRGFELAGPITQDGDVDHGAGCYRASA